MLFKLAGDRAVLRPVAGIVGPHGEFVDQEADAGAGGFKEFRRHHPGHAEFGRDAQGRVLRRSSDFEGDLQRRGDDFVADAVHLDGVYHRPGPGFAAGGPRHQRGQFTAEFDFGFGEERAHDLEPRSGVFGVFGGVDDPYALAVVTAAGHFEDHGPADFVAEAHERGDVSDSGPDGVWQPQPVDGRPHHQLVLRVDQGVRARLDVHTSGQKRAEVVRWNVFVVERHNIQALGEVEECLEVPVVTHR